MPKVIGPLFSIGASGTFRNELEFRSNGTDTKVYAARKPPATRSTAQQVQAERFRLAVEAWKLADQTTRDDWNAAAVVLPVSGYQYFIQQYQAQAVVPPDLPVVP